MMMNDVNPDKTLHDNNHQKDQTHRVSAPVVKLVIDKLLTIEQTVASLTSRLEVIQANQEAILEMLKNDRRHPRRSSTTTGTNVGQVSLMETKIKSKKKKPKERDQDAKSLLRQNTNRSASQPFSGTVSRTGPTTVSGNNQAGGQEVSRPANSPLPSQLVGALLTWGGSSTSLHGSCLIYIPSRNKWAAFWPFPHPLNGAGMVHLDGVLYLCGGYSEDVSHQSGIYSMRVSAESDEVPTRNWTHVLDLPLGLAGHACVELNSKIYLLGGYLPGQTKGFVFDPVTRRLKPIAGSPQPIWFAGVVAHQANHSLYCLRLDSKPTRAHRYDSRTDTWQPVRIQGLRPLARRDGHRLVPFSENAFCSVGGGGSLGNRDVELFMVDTQDPNVLHCVNLPDMPVARHTPGAAALDGILYAAGGWNDSSGGMERLYPHLGVWEHCAGMPPGEKNNFELLPIRMPVSSVDKLTFF